MKEVPPELMELWRGEAPKSAFQHPEMVFPITRSGAILLKTLITASAQSCLPGTIAFVASRKALLGQHSVSIRRGGASWGDRRL
jgi:hypothetical protein